MLMQSDIRTTSLYQEAEALHHSLRQPGTGQISDAADVHASPNQEYVAYAGVIVDTLHGSPATRICITRLESGETRVLTSGPNTDRLPKFSPDGSCIAFLSDRHRAGDFQLHLLDFRTGSIQPTSHVSGWVEYLHWSPDGRHILLGVAGHGADIGGGQGGVSSKRFHDDPQSWMPTVVTQSESYRWRAAWVYELQSHRVREVLTPGINIWEAAWCGEEALVAVVSPGPDEGLWYTARLQVIPIKGGGGRTIYSPSTQLGCIASSPSGALIALVEAHCSDRWIVAGDVKVIDTTSAKVLQAATAEIDITHIEWRSNRHLLVAGHRNLASVVGLYDVETGVCQETWEGHDVSSGARYFVVSGLGVVGDCTLVGDGFTRAPEIAVIRCGKYEAVKSFDLRPREDRESLFSAEQLSWRASDGLMIQGWLLRPKGGAGPYPLVMQIHGGPVWIWHPTWLARNYSHLLMLIRRGFAVFLPNPRGSAGRGQSFIGAVIGDMGGVDTYDYLSGIDHLVKMGVADPNRLAVTGVSYGGFMSSWLITQDSRFAAAVPVAPVTNHVTQHLISNLGVWVSMYLGDTYTNPGGKYFERSPIMYAHRVKTPTLNICGALDRCTPPEEAVQFHNALLENGVKSTLVTYPEEGHGIRQWPAAIDYAARLVGWIDEHIPDATQHC